MAAKAKTVYVCAECGHESARWSGQCPSCGAWNCMNEELRSKATAFAPTRPAVTVAPKKLSDIDEKDDPRLKTGIAELDRVLGGGIVPGSLVLLGGDPGIGKSTLLTQVSAHLAAQHSVLHHRQPPDLIAAH